MTRPIALVGGRVPDVWVPIVGGPLDGRFTRAVAFKCFVDKTEHRYDLRWTPRGLWADYVGVVKA